MTPAQAAPTVVLENESRPAEALRPRGKSDFVTWQSPIDLTIGIGGGMGAAAGAAGDAGESIGTMDTSIATVAGLAGGGDLSAGSSYLVGEQGPEILSGISGRITSNAESRRMLGAGAGSVTNNIDARGADLGAENRIRRGIEMSHKSAVATSVQVVHDRPNRVPAGR